MASMHRAAIASLFLQAWETKAGPSPDAVDIGSLTLDDAYAVQQAVIEHRVARGDRVAGYKVGCTSRAVRRQLGLSEPICGRLMAPYVYFGETTLGWGDYVECAVEPEFVLCMGKDIRSDVSNDEELRDAIDWVAPGIEVHNSKFWFGEPTLQELIASNGIHAALVVGRQRLSPADLDFGAETVRLVRNGEQAASGSGAEIMGGPLESLRWLVTHLLRRGEYLRAGQLVIPGSPVALVSVDRHDRITAALAHVGEVSADFA